MANESICVCNEKGGRVLVVDNIKLDKALCGRVETNV